MYLCDINIWKAYLEYIKTDTLTPTVKRLIYQPQELIFICDPIVEKLKLQIEEHFIETIFKKVQCLPFNQEAIAIYERLEKNHALEKNDLKIAAIAIAHSATLISNNKHFEQIEDLLYLYDD